MYTTFDREVEKGEGGEMNRVLSKEISKNEISIQETLEQIQELKKNDLKLNIQIFNSLIFAYLQIGQNEEAMKIVDSKFGKIDSDDFFVI